MVLVHAGAKVQYFCQTNDKKTENLSFSLQNAGKQQKQ
jgi:hypothetical protein